MLIDKFEICRSGFKLVLEENFEDPIICEANSIETALSCLDSHGSDVVVMTLDDKINENDPAFIRLRELAVNIPVIVVGNANNRSFVEDFYNYNFKGFLDRSNNKEIMVAAIKLLLAGGTYFPPEVHLMDTENTEYPSVNRDQQRDTIGRLTKRQREVLRAISEGKSNKKIAVELGISAGTVKVHVSNLMKDLQAKNRAQAVSIANNLELL